MTDEPPIREGLLVAQIATGVADSTDHGDSGAKKATMKIGTGQIHWMAYGTRYDHCVSPLTKPFSIPEAMSCPMTQHKLT